MRVTKTPVPPKINNNVSQWVVSGYKYQFLGLSLESLDIMQLVCDGVILDLSDVILGACATKINRSKQRALNVLYYLFSVSL